MGRFRSFCVVSGPSGLFFYWGKERFKERSRYQTIRQSDDRHQMTETALRTPSFRVERSEIEKSPRITQPGAIVRKGIRHTARLSSIFYLLSSIFYLPMSDTLPVWRLFILKSQTSYFKSVILTQLKNELNFFNSTCWVKNELSEICTIKADIITYKLLRYNVCFYLRSIFNVKINVT